MPLWTEADAEAALAYMDHLDSLCTGCGHPRTESFDPANAFKYQTEPITCHACRDRKRTADSRSRSDTADTDGEYLVTDLGVTD